jgi:hypothetical protein
MPIHPLYGTRSDAIPVTCCAGGGRFHLPEYAPHVQATVSTVLNAKRRKQSALIVKGRGGQRQNIQKLSSVATTKPVDPIHTT